MAVLGGDPARVFDARRPLPAFELSEGREWLLSTPGPGGWSLEVLPGGLVPVLSAAAKGATRAALLAELEACGAEGPEAVEVLDDLIEDGLIRGSGTIRAR